MLTKLEQLGHINSEKSVTLEKVVTLGKEGHVWKNKSNLEKWVTFAKMGHT